MARIPEEERLHALTSIEREHWGKPGRLLCGMDEVGRGPLAGPVVAACVALPEEPLIHFINDSKKLSALRREQLSELILAQAICYATAFVEPSVIDEINILQATKLAFCRAYEGLVPSPTHVLADAITGLNIPAHVSSYVRGDTLSYLIAAASIVAKVERDRYMRDVDAQYPQYGFAQNKGYGTATHIAALREYGPCPLHRRSFISHFVTAHE